MEFLTDQDLLKGCISGDSQAQESFVRMFSDPVYKSLQHSLRVKNVPYTQADIEDLHNEVFFRLFEKGCRKLSQYEGKNGCSLSNWLRIVTARIVIDHLRKKHTDALTREGKTLPLDAVIELEGQTPDPLTLMDKEEQLRLLRQGLSVLLPRDRLFLKLHFLEGKPISKVADILGLSESNAHSLKHRAIQRLKKMILEKEKSDPL